MSSPNQSRLKSSPPGGSRRSPAGRKLAVFFAAILSAAPVLLLPGRAMADSHSGYLVDDGIAIYYAVIPAEMIRGHPKGHPEATMHGGVPGRPHVHHLMVALFNASTLERIDDAEAKATVSEIGLAGRAMTLEPFTVANALTYGNYFEVRPNTNYRIRVDVKTPRPDARASVQFEFRHQ